MSLTWHDRCAVVLDLYMIIKAATLPTLKTLFGQPLLALQPTKLRGVFFENVWKFMGDGVDEGARETKTDLLPRGRGVLLEIGAGHGHSCKYLDRRKVTRYIALEPNVLMHDKIVLNATKAGFSPDQIQIIGHGAEETDKILNALDGDQVDTIVSILSLCGIPNAENSVARMAKDILKPGGEFLFYEHVRCDPSPTLIWWQSFWTPVWQAVVGCRLDKPSHTYVEKLNVWEERKVWGKLPSEQPNLFWHRVGVYKKKII